MTIPRKREMTPLQHAVCDEVKNLRRDLQMSVNLFARQLGVNPRQIFYWEGHRHCPRMNHVVRLKQLRDMQEHLDVTDAGDLRQYRHGAIFVDAHRRPRPLKTRAVKAMAGKLLAILLRQVGGGPLMLEKALIAKQRMTSVHIRETEDKVAYKVWLKDRKEDKRVKNRNEQ